MSIKRTLRYHWLKFLRLQDDPRKLAWGMALGIFIGITPTIPFHFVSILFLAPLLRISPVTAFLGIQIMNPLTIPILYLAAFKVGHFLLHQGAPLRLPETYCFADCMDLIWRGGLALQLGGVIIAIPPAIASYFLTRWIIKRYRRLKARKAASVPNLLSQNPPAASGPKA
ncbi:MAG: DUF2062 domain-containing protein [Deltaproteobacteria bacterium]|nr:DUF2062 domain-containing protein [Deltaproteobacteria bacterium]